MDENAFTSDELVGACEAMLFVTDEPLNPVDIAEMVQVDVADVLLALDKLQKRLAERDAGLQLREVAGGWRLFTHPRYHDLIEKYVISWDTRRLSQAALETLAAIAYNQPITKSGIAAIRGVNSESSINSLMEKGLVREAGREQSPGQPVLYATSKAFLEKFGLRSLADLPDLEDYAPDEESRALIRERLGVTRADVDEADEALYDAELELDLADDIVDMREQYRLDFLGGQTVDLDGGFDGE